MSHDHWPHEEDGEAVADESAKADTFWTLRPKPVSDEEFIEQLRNSSETVRRWRWMALLFIAFIAAVIWEMRRVFQGPGPVAPGGMVFSLEELLFFVSMAGLVGLTFGFKIGHWFQMAAEMFWGDRRTQLLIRYHDLLDEHELLSHQPTAPQPDNHM